jgi:hypothetical protein
MDMSDVLSAIIDTYRWISLARFNSVSSAYCAKYLPPFWLLLLLPRNSEELLFLAFIILADDLSVGFVIVMSLCELLCEPPPRACEHMGHCSTMNAKATMANVFRPAK